MRRSYPVLLGLLLVTIGARGQETAPLMLTRTIELPAEVKGHFDHFGVDLAHHRLFATPEEYKAVLVFDLNSGKTTGSAGWYAGTPVGSSSRIEAFCEPC